MIGCVRWVERTCPRCSCISLPYYAEPPVKRLILDQRFTDNYLTPFCGYATVGWTVTPGSYSIQLLNYAYPVLPQRYHARLTQRFTPQFTTGLATLRDGAHMPVALDAYLTR